jgi:hypothetical protein
VRLYVAPGTGAHGLCVYGDERAPLRIATSTATDPVTSPR